MRKLTAKQKEFIKAYLKVYGIGTRAVLMAYPKVKNRNTAAVMAHELSGNSKIRKIIEEQLEKDNWGRDFVDFEIID